MLVVPGVLVIGPVVLLAVAPHANFYLLFLVPAIAHIHLLTTTPCIHGLRTCSYKVQQRKAMNMNTFYVMSLSDTESGLYHIEREANSNTAITICTCRLFTHQTCAAHPSHTQSHGYPG